MDELTQPLATEIERLREAYAALNRNDIDGVIRSFDASIERVEPADFPGAGTYRGLDAVKAHFVKARESWAEGTCEPQRLLVSGDRVVVFAHVHVKLKNEAEWRDGDVTDVFTFRNGKVVYWRTFTDRQQALEWAGVEPSDLS